MYPEILGIYMKSVYDSQMLQ